MKDPCRWAPGPIWRGATVAILAGGPSLTPAQAEACRGRAITVVVNNSYLLAPWATLLYACDARWWGWHRPAWAFAGLQATQDRRAIQERPTGLLWLEQTFRPEGGSLGYDPTPGCIRTGHNGGYQALHLTLQLGAARVLLLGFDMRPAANRTHWHEEHPHPTDPCVFARLMVPAFDSILPAVQQLGTRVVNCTPDSALRCFPTATVEDELCRPTF